MKHRLNTDQAELGTNTGRPGPTAVRKGGQQVGKWPVFARIKTALTRLGPDNSTQVVDFPRMAVVRLFSEGARIGFSGPKREVAI
jgi:hypothetical protein